jgi:predicted enzyme related to lactoylglutathione lyase
VWRELVTDDVEGALRFYGGLFGWTWKGEDMGPAGTYWLASRDGRQLCGAMRTPPGPPMPSAWSSYALVEDVDAACARAASAGGEVLRAPADIPDVGRFAVVADPWGAAFLPFRAHREDDPPPQGLPPPGHFCWETLVTPDVAGAVAFYGRVLGHGTAKAPEGSAVILTAGGVPVADVQPAPPGVASHWATYVAVEGAEASRDRAAGLGGRVLIPRIDVPGVGTVAFVADPSDAFLGLFQPVARP